MSADKKVWVDYPRRGYMPQSVKELEEIVMAVIKANQPKPVNEILESSGRVLDFYNNSREAVKSPERQHSRELTGIMSSMNLPFRETGFYTGIVNGKEKIVFYAHSYPRTFEEALKYFALWMPKCVRFLFLNPGDASGGDFETAYKCPECGYWIEGSPLRQYNENVLISDHSASIPTKAEWYRVVCALSSCAAILDESDEMEELF